MVTAIKETTKCKNRFKKIFMRSYLVIFKSVFFKNRTICEHFIKSITISEKNSFYKKKVITFCEVRHENRFLDVFSLA